MADLWEVEESCDYEFPGCRTLFGNSIHKPMKHALLLAFIVSCFSLSSADAASPRIECDSAMLSQARKHIKDKSEPFWSYWQLAKKDAAKALMLKPSPCYSHNSLVFHGEAQEQGIACRLLAYKWRLENDEEAGTHAVLLLDAWASGNSLPGTQFDSAIRFPNSGMDVARGMLPFVAAYDLLQDHAAITPEVSNRIQVWFRALSEVVKKGMQRWQSSDDFGQQEFQNHHAAHILGLVLFGTALNDAEMIQFAADSPDNPKDFKEIIGGLILMPGDDPQHGRTDLPIHAGELMDRARTSQGNGLTYCHLSLTLMLYTADVLNRVTGEDWLNWTAPGGECLKLSATFYSDFFRLRNAHINGKYYSRDQVAIQYNTPYLGTFEVVLHHWPDVPNLKALVRSTDRVRTPRSWLCYYGLPLLTHGVTKP